MDIRGCWSCGSHRACFPDCECAKCVDPDSYELWKATESEEYGEWLASQELEHGEICDCPGCI